MPKPERRLSKRKLANALTVAAYFVQRLSPTVSYSLNLEDDHAPVLEVECPTLYAFNRLSKLFIAWPPKEARGHSVRRAGLRIIYYIKESPNAP